MDVPLLAKYEELLEAYEHQAGQLAEAHTSLENLKWGFKQREEGLMGQLEQYKHMAVKLHDSNTKLRDELRAVCEKMCDDLVVAERVVDRDVEDQEAEGDAALSADGCTATLQLRVAELEAALATATRNPPLSSKSPHKSPLKSSARVTASAAQSVQPALTVGGLSGGGDSGSGSPSRSPAPPAAARLLPPAGLTTAQVSGSTLFIAHIAPLPLAQPHRHAPTLPA